MLIVFKKVYKYLKEVNRDIVLQNQNTEVVEVLKRKQRLLNEIRDSLVSYDWVKHTSAKQKVACFIESNFNYMKVVEEFGISYASARASLSQLGKQFEKEIGVGILDEIMYGNLAIAEVDLSQNSNSISGLLVSDLRPLLPKGELNDLVNILECRKEISFLQFFTLRRLNDGLNRLDMEKLSHIIGVLEDTTEVYGLEKEILKGYLAGDVKRWEEVEKLLEEVLHYGR